MQHLQIALTAGLLAATTAFGETREVGTAAELVTALGALTNTSDEIVLTSSTYDVGSYKMIDEDGKTSHLFVKGCKVRGRSSNARETVIYGNLTQRIVYLQNGAELHGLTISNGYNSSSYASGVRASDANSICSNCVITCNMSPGEDCGGVMKATCYDCEICNNYASYGAGASYCTLWRCNVHDNCALRSGGGCLTVNLHACRVACNMAYENAGGIACNTDCSSFDSEIVSNRAVGTTFSKTRGGGAHHLSGTVEGHSFTFSNCVFACNSVSNGCGGGASCAILRDCRVLDNVAMSGGGTFSSKVYDSQICGNRIVNTEAWKPDYGGGGSFKDVLVDGCGISNNVATYYGGGVHSSTVINSRIFGNLCTSTPETWSAATAGGGLYAGSASNCTVSGNALANGEAYGGAVNRTILRDSIVCNNYAAYGAAMQYGEAYGTTFYNNATGNGSCTFRQTVYLEGCQIEATNIDGGALYGCTITGGGVRPVIAEGANVMTSGTFSAAGSLMTATTATNCLFHGNVRLDTLAHGPYSGSGSVTHLSSCTIAGNRYDALASAFPGKCSATLILDNCLISANETKFGAAKHALTVASPSSDTQIRVTNCLVSQAPDATWQPEVYANIMTNAARFTSVDVAHPFALHYASPGRKMGAVREWMSAANDIRGTGYPRLRDGQVDIGCYQCWLDPNGLILLVK